MVQERYNFFVAHQETHSPKLACQRHKTSSQKHFLQVCACVGCHAGSLHWARRHGICPPATVGPVLACGTRVGRNAPVLRMRAVVSSCAKCNQSKARRLGINSIDGRNADDSYSDPKQRQQWPFLSKGQLLALSMFISPRCAVNVIQPNVMITLIAGNSSLMAVHPKAGWTSVAHRASSPATCACAEPASWRRSDHETSGRRAPAGCESHGAAQLFLFSGPCNLVGGLLLPRGVVGPSCGESKKRAGSLECALARLVSMSNGMKHTLTRCGQVVRREQLGLSIGPRLEM